MKTSMRFDLVDLRLFLFVVEAANIRVCRRLQGARAPIRQYNCNRRVPSAVLAAFLSEHPQIDIDLEERSSRDIVRAVAGNLAEIGIVGTRSIPPKNFKPFRLPKIGSY